MGDEYEKGIAPSSEVLFRDKIAARLLFFASGGMATIFLIAAIACAAQGLIAGTIATGLMVVVTALLGLTRSVLRTVVTRTDVRIHWGLWGPRIPLSSIKSVRVRDTSTRQALIEASAEKGRPKIELFQIPTPGAAVEIEWTDEVTGKGRRLWLSASDAPGLADAIERASVKMKNPTAQTTKARVDVTSEIEAQAAEEELEEELRKDRAQ